MSSSYLFAVWRDRTRRSQRRFADVDLFFDHEIGKFGLLEAPDVTERAASIFGNKAVVMTRNSLHPGLKKRIEDFAVRVSRWSSGSPRRASRTSSKRSSGSTACSAA